MNPLRSRFWCIAWLALAGCPAPVGSSDGGIDGGEADGGSRAQDVLPFCTAFLAEVAARDSDCFSGPAADWALTIDPAYCHQAAWSVDAGRATFDPARASACLATLADAGCTQLYQVLADPSSDCMNAIAGASGAGAACFSPFDCLPGQACNNLNGACPGTCVAPVADGLGCGQQTLCGWDSQCAPNGTCARLGNLGDPCFDTSHVGCNDGLICVGFTATTGGTCQPAPSSGPCGYAFSCDDLHTCSSYSTDSGVCIPLKPIGAACQYHPDGVHECEGFSSCQPPPGNPDAGWVCTEYSQLGGPCGAINNQYWGCVDGWCPAWGGTGTGSPYCAPFFDGGESCDFSRTDQCGFSFCIQATNLCAQACLQP